MPDQTLRALVTRRRQPWRAVLLVAAFPLLFMGAMGGEEGAFPWYGGLALICLFQAAYPTLLGWTLVTVIYLFCSAIFVYLTIADLIELIRGGRASIFVNPVDDAVFSSLVVACLAIGVALAWHRPKPIGTCTDPAK